MLGLGVVISFRMGKPRKQYPDCCGLSFSLCGLSFLPISHR